MKRTLLVMGASALLLVVVTWHEAIYVTAHGHGILQGPNGLRV